MLMAAHGNTIFPPTYEADAFFQRLFSYAEFIVGNRGSTVINVLCYNSEGRWFDPSSGFFIDIKSF